MQNESRRGGFSLLELVVTGVLLSVVMVSAVPMLAWVGLQRRAADQHQFALHEAANILERLTLEDWEHLTPESAEELTLSEQAQSYLPDAELAVTVAETVAEPSDVPPSKRLSVELRWRDPAGNMTPPVRLTTWLYRSKEAQ
jgi:Tfp pilus assembly protein PilV